MASAPWTFRTSTGLLQRESATSYARTASTSATAASRTRRRRSAGPERPSVQVCRLAEVAEAKRPVVRQDGRRMLRARQRGSRAQTRDARDARRCLTVTDDAGYGPGARSRPGRRGPSAMRLAHLRGAPPSPTKTVRPRRQAPSDRPPTGLAAREPRSNCIRADCHEVTAVKRRHAASGCIYVFELLRLGCSRTGVDQRREALPRRVTLLFAGCGASAVEPHDRCSSGGARTRGASSGRCPIAESDCALLLPCLATLAYFGPRSRYPGAVEASAARRSRWPPLDPIAALAKVDFAAERPALDGSADRTGIARDLTRAN
jgi:hypothetical protein